MIFCNGHREIGFYIPEGFKGEIGENLPETPIDIKIIEFKKFENLLMYSRKRYLNLKINLNLILKITIRK